MEAFKIVEMVDMSAYLDIETHTWDIRFKHHFMSKQSAIEGELLLPNRGGGGWNQFM